MDGPSWKAVGFQGDVQTMALHNQSKKSLRRPAFVLSLCLIGLLVYFGIVEQKVYLMVLGLFPLCLIAEVKVNKLQAVKSRYVIESGLTPKSAAKLFLSS